MSLEDLRVEAVRVVTAEESGVSWLEGELSVALERLGPISVSVEGVCVR